MLRNISNSRLFFVALGVTIALCGVRVYAGPGSDDPRSAAALERIASSLERIQRDGLEVKQSNGNKLRLSVDRMP